MEFNLAIEITTRRVVKVTLVTVGAVPLIGLAGTVSALSKDDPKEENRRLVRACDLPLYEVARTKKLEEENVELYHPSSLENQISSVRTAVSEFFLNFKSSYDSVKSTVGTGIDHSKSTLQYVQTNPDELPRIAFITVATMGGFVLGYRGSIVRKVLYAGIAGTSSAALCYPTYTIGLSSELAGEATQMWKDNIGWPLEDSSDSKKGAIPGRGNINVSGDPGQSNAEDKDMYSTRS